MTDNDTNLDLREAERLMREAKTDEDRSVALRFHAEGVRNLIQSGLSDPFVKAVETVLAREIGALSSRQSYFFNQLDTEFKTNAAWRDKYSKEIDATLAELKVVSASMGKIETDIDALRQGYNSNVARITAIEEYARGSRRAELDTIARRQAAHDQELLRIGREIETIKPFFQELISPDEQADKDDAAASLAAELRELLAWVREERQRRANDG